MAVYISEFTRLVVDDNGASLPLAPVPAVAEQRVAVGGASAQSAAFGANVRFVMVHAKSAAGLAFGPDPTAVNNRHVIGAGETRWYAVRPGDKIAVIAAE